MEKYLFHLYALLLVTSHPLFTDDVQAITNGTTRISATTGPKTKFFGRRHLYYSNGVATAQVLRLRLSGDVELNPGPVASRGNSTKTTCSGCSKAIRQNQVGVYCSECTCRYHNKCTGMNRKELLSYRKQGSWYCYFCSLPQFSDSFFEDSGDNECSLENSTRSQLEDDEPDCIEWYSTHINNYYQSNLKVAYPGQTGRSKKHAHSKHVRKF